MKTSCYVEEARYKRPHTVRSHVDEIFRVGKSIEMESRLEVAWRGRNGE